MAVSEKRNNRWFIIIVSGIAAIALIGVPLAASLSGLSQSSPQAASSPSAMASPSAEAQKELEETARGYQAVLQREPNNQTALRGLVDVRIQQRDVKGAIAPLEKLAELNPTEADYGILLAQAKQQLQDREGAAEAYRKILAAQPGNPKALNGLVALLLEQQRPEAAVGVLQDALKTAEEANKIKPDSVDVTAVQMLLGQVYATESRFDEAIAIFDKAIERDRQDYRPIVGKALVLQDQGKDAEAKPLFASAEALAPAQFKDRIKQLAAGQPPTPAAPITSPGADPTPVVSPEASPAPATSPTPNE
ncbi:MAG: tetratricopeptide repeat protein [Timaviella obliquedivisa GSE-PSE-MK23-08B]|nr:tetratricopeptide repeat protein [Timaviella obliquedivisa GSE-PSE-MK23-08B]